MENNSRPKKHKSRKKTMPCKHFKALKDESLLKNYKLLYSFYVACTEKNSFQRKKNDCKCYAKKCKKNRIHACLSCVHFGCEKHIRSHAKQAKHRLAMDTKFGSIYCSKCKDYQYDFDFMQISEEQDLLAYEKRGTLLGAYKREPDLDEKDLLNDHEEEFNTETDLSNGLINMGNTCYMNVVVQTFIHAPIFRDYLFSFKHKCKYTSENENELPTDCIFCEMVNVAQKCISKDKEDCALTSFLYPFWKRINVKKEEVGMRDANEFFQELLFCLHTDCLKSTNDQNRIESSCPCIIHNIFAVSFGNIKTCTNCGNVTNSYQVCWDIVLALYGVSEVLTFNECLERCFQEEEINEYSCSACKKRIKCISKSYVKDLPIVLCFQLNLETECFTNYTEFLDMTPYTLPSNTENNLNPIRYMFYLFAVIICVSAPNVPVHERRGHYYCFVRLDKEKWIRCDDDEITSTGEIFSDEGFEEVHKLKKKKKMNVMTRMLFYHRTFIPFIKVENDIVV